MRAFLARDTTQGRPSYYKPNACVASVRFSSVEYAHQTICDTIREAILTRISISRPLEWRSAGTGLCSYRVRGVDGSCAEHLTVESYTVFICQQSYLLLLGIPSPTHTFIPGLKPSFSANPSHRSPSLSSSGLTTWIPQTVYGYF